MRRVLGGAAVAVFLAVGLPLNSAAAAPPSTETPYIVVLKDTVADPAVLAATQAQKFGATVHAVYSTLDSYSASMTAAEAAALRTDATIQFVTASTMFSTGDRKRISPNCDRPIFTTGQCLPEGVDRIDGDLSSTRSGDHRGAVNVNIAVIDSGIDPAATDLNVKGSIDCSTGAPLSTPRIDYGGHGTGVAGVAAAKDNDTGVVGVAPGAPLWDVRVFGVAEETPGEAILCGIDYVTRTRTDSDPANDIAIANMSLSGEGTDDQHCGFVNQDPMHASICRSVAKGVTYVVAAGNDGVDFASFVPAAYNEVLTATAMEDFDGRSGGKAAPVCFGFDYSQYGLGEEDDLAAPFSNYSSGIDRLHTVAAPGACIPTTPAPASSPPDAVLAIYDGTSFASPHVAGTVALCMSSGRCSKSNPLATVARIQLEAAAYSGGNKQYGYRGDPLRPLPGKYYGFLDRAALY